MKKLWHYLFHCSSFWQLTRAFHCPDCGRGYRCYWDGHDCDCGIVNLCGRCEPRHRVHIKAIVAAMLLLLILPALTHAQRSQPLQLVSDCIAGVYDECQLVQGHWYHRKGTVWTRDDGQVIAPPIVPVVTCPVQQAFKKSSRYDWSFVKDWKFATGVGFSFAVTGYDISTGHGQEHTRFYRNDQGQLNKGKYWLVTGGVNAALLPLDLQPNHKWRWVSFGGRVTLALIRFNQARKNR